ALPIWPGRGGRHRGHAMHSPHGPDGSHGPDQDVIVMTVDQYETLRLIDLEGMTQEGCAESMHIARTTVQSIYAEARKKLADALVNGKMLRIEGGEYRLCSGEGASCGGGGCRRGRNR
ncbi:DUF134 domain-containing protein, partial [Desulfovibrio sp. 1188_IL3213]|uniref:DUF134 domain-containing protein n=1 Tax=Desulfovibrio sp. 1188_IL3213 TaxID=3084052 RepID=UPI002FDB10C0